MQLGYCDVHVTIGSVNKCKHPVTVDCVNWQPESTESHNYDRCLQLWGTCLYVNHRYFEPHLQQTACIEWRPILIKSDSLTNHPKPEYDEIRVKETRHVFDFNAAVCGALLVAFGAN